MEGPHPHPDRSGVNRFGEENPRPDVVNDQTGVPHRRLGELESGPDWSEDPRSEAARERFTSDDHSPYGGPGYHEREHPGVSGKDESGETWIDRRAYDAQRSFLGKGPKGYQRSDDRIYEEVCEALRDDPTVDASEIGVLVQDGIVSLEGAANTRMEKRLAEVIASEVPGVLDVRNDIKLL